MAEAKLSTEDVIEIKRLLAGFGGKISQQKIADKFGVSRGTITDIRFNKTYKNVVIDENGNYINNEIEILPENFPVPIIEEVEEKESPIQDETKEYRVKFVEEYFVKKGKRHEPNSKKSKSFIYSIWHSYKWLFNNEENDFMSEIMLSVTRTVMTFQPKDKYFDWSKVSTAGTREYSILHDNVNKIIKTDVKNYANEVNNNYSVKKDGQVEWLKPVVESFDTVLSGEDGDSSLIEFLSDEMNHFHMKDDYFYSHFLDWFSNSHEDILTKDQIKFLNIMKFFQRDRDDEYLTPYSQLPDTCKPYSESAVGSMRHRLKHSTEEAYAVVEKKGLREMSIDKELKFWAEFMGILKDDGNLNEQNEILSKWVIEKKENNFMEKILFNVDADGILSIRKNEISSKLLYKIVVLIENRIEELKGHKRTEKNVNN
ncbi:hypothetical protein [Bacillus sp. FJAT-50079]|uniref:hypothetical protein n=1 Tax=Bacillus sp. FJAT-50079 TaxID=2833577 RepID=UPI001BC9B52A|nr:hypothetical protein [Bacillus sp. FJAT-50079]MBS4207463.1 hypothetical protein [Bacillus sp. FJAT-50079]